MLWVVDAIAKVGEKQSFHREKTPALHSGKVMILVAGIDIDEIECDKDYMDHKNQSCQRQVDL